MTDTYKGKVKWYSIRKGFGFVTPSGDDAPTKDDIFFHQTSILSDVKNKWLESNYECDFTVYTDDDGKYRCKSVTAPGGAACEIPKRKSAPRKRGGKGKKDGTDDEGEATDGGGDTDAGKKEAKGEDGENKGKGRNRRGGGKKKDGEGDKKEGEKGDSDKKPNGTGGGRKPRKRFDDDITADVKAKMKDKKLDMRQTSLLLSMEKTRLKFGPDGYAALAHADGIMAEGTFTCDDEGKVTLTWKNMLKFEGGEWKTGDASSKDVVSSFNWTDDNVSGLKSIETPESLWGEGKTDPADALLSNNFQMRKCFLAKGPANPRNNRRRPRPKAGKKPAGKENGKEEGEKKENGKEAETASS